MHIYIRTGDNENTGIEFLNGKGWELSGYERKGFDYTPPARLGRQRAGGVSLLALRAE